MLFADIIDNLYYLDHITIPELRKIARKIAKDDYRQFLNNNPLDKYELKFLHAFVIGYANDKIEILIDYFQKFIPYVNDWAICDSLCQSFKIARIYQDEVFNMILNYTNSYCEFETRIVAVTLLSHFLNDFYIDKVLSILNSLHTQDYYSQMGVAWAIASIMAKYPQLCLNYLLSPNCHLDSPRPRQ